VLAQSILLLGVVGLGVALPGDWARREISAAGGLLFALGGVIGVAGVRVLGRNRTPFPRPQPDSELIQHGIYAWMRHPLYTSVMLASLGWAGIWQSWPALAVAVGQIPFFLAKARREEAWLRAQFPGYAEYARRVPAFLPRFGHRRPV
jgi:protein-S-isoprenylcysteine O-methyltransferase Ste14